MTQFALIKMKDSETVHEGLIKLSDIDDSFLSSVAEKLFSNLELQNIYTVKVGNADVDELLLVAQKQLDNGIVFSQTDIAKLLRMVFDQAEEIVFWYGAEYDDLDYVSDIDNLLKKLEISLREPSCEVYIHFKRNG